MNRRLYVQLFVVLCLLAAAVLTACAPSGAKPASTAIPEAIAVTTATPLPPVEPTVAPAVEPIVDLPEPPQPVAPAFNDQLPETCRMADHETYVNPFDGYCFAYPSRFELETSEIGQPVLYGPALDQNLDAIRASLSMEVEVAIKDATLSQIVDGYLKQFEGLDVPAITRSAITLGGEPAEVLEVVPGREGSRDIFALHDGTLYHFMFMPSVRDFAVAKADVEELYSVVTTSFSFTSKKPRPLAEPVVVSASPRDPGVSGVARWGTMPVPDAIVELRTGDWRVNPEATLQRAMTDPEGRYFMANAPAGDFVMCGLFPDGAQERSTCTPVHIEAGQDVAGIDVMLVRELPVLEPVANAQVAAVPTLAWKSYLGAAKYEVFIIDAGTTELVVHGTVADTLFSSPTPLKAGRTYTWVVNALAADGGLLADASSRYDCACLSQPQTRLDVSTPAQLSEGRFFPPRIASKIQLWNEDSQTLCHYTKR